MLTTPTRSPTSPSLTTPAPSDDTFRRIVPTTPTPSQRHQHTFSDEVSITPTGSRAQRRRRRQHHPTTPFDGQCRRRQHHLNDAFWRRLQDHPSMHSDGICRRHRHVCRCRRRRQQHPTTSSDGCCRRHLTTTTPSSDAFRRMVPTMRTDSPTLPPTMRASSDAWCRRRRPLSQRRLLTTPSTDVSDDADIISTTPFYDDTIRRSLPTGGADDAERFSDAAAYDASPRTTPSDGWSRQNLLFTGCK